MSLPKGRSTRGRKAARKRARLEAPPAGATTRRSFRIRSTNLWLALGLVALTLVVYAPVRRYGFVDLDDPQYVSENVFVAGGLTWHAVRWAFTSIHASYWLPLIWISHMLDVQIYGLNAGGHHVTNVVLQVANTVLLFALFYRMTGATGRSAFVAALFAIHPLHVESVVWVTERKDVLSTLFLLLTLWSYVDYVRQPSTKRYAWALLFFVLGLMSKPMLVTLPFMLLLLDWWPLGRFNPAHAEPGAGRRKATGRLVLEKLPFLILASAAAVATYVTQRATGAVVDTARVPVGFRAANAVVSYATYVIQMFWPTRLALFYPYPLHLSTLVVASSVVAIIGTTVLVVWSARRYPYLAVGWLWYLGTLVPVIGIVQAGDQARADRFTYVPLIGIFIMVAWAAHDLFGRSRVTRAAAVAAVALASVVARVQVGYWRNNTVLWEHALRAADESYVAHTNLGLAVYARGRTDSAITEFHAALRLRPDFAEAYNDLGVALADRGDVDAAIEAFLNATRAKPTQAPSHYNAAVLLAGKGDTTAAVRHLQTALALDPGYADARRELDRLRRGTSPR